jgi:hypothetical protein
MKRIEYLSNIGKETLKLEYKIFSMPFQFISCISNDHEKLEQLIIEGEWKPNFNAIIYRSLIRYIDTYLPRYICGFLDQHSHTNEGELLFGVDDNGTIHGIPYQGDIMNEISCEKIKKYISESFLFQEEEKRSNTYLDYMDVEWVKVDFERKDVSYEVIDQKFEQYQNLKKDVHRKMQKRIRSYQRWKRYHTHYSQKLVDLYNHPSSNKKFEDFVKRNAPHQVYLELKNGFEIQQKRFIDIQNYRKSQDNIYYWLCEWKDRKIQNILKNKPKPVDLHFLNSPYRYGPVHMFSNFSEMNPKWISKNDDVNLYMLRFTFKRPENGLSISYLSNLSNSSKNKKERYYRVLQNENPCCIPY